MEIFNRKHKCICIIPLFGSSLISSFIYLHIYKYPFCLVSLVLLRKAAAKRKRNLSTSSKTRFFKYRMTCRHSKVAVKEIALCKCCLMKHTHIVLCLAVFFLSVLTLLEKQNKNQNKQKTPPVLPYIYLSLFKTTSYWTHWMLDYRMEYITMLWWLLSIM